VHMSSLPSVEDPRIEQLCSLAEDSAYGFSSAVKRRDPARIKELTARGFFLLPSTVLSLDNEAFFRARWARARITLLIHISLSIPDFVLPPTTQRT